MQNEKPSSASFGLRPVAGLRKGKPFLMSFLFFAQSFYNLANIVVALFCDLSANRMNFLNDRIIPHNYTLSKTSNFSWQYSAS